MDLKAIFRAGFVRRWHANPDLCHTVDRIDGHSARVARIILKLHPEPSIGLIAEALIHDDGESVTGDMPHTGKIGRVGAELRAAEGKAVRNLWGASFLFSGDDLEWLAFADRLDAYMWAKHHAPHIMAGDGWPRSRNDILNAAAKLGVGEAVLEVV